MIGWIALAVAADAHGDAEKAQKMAGKALHKTDSNSPLVIVKPFDLVKKPVRETKGFWDRLFSRRKEVLDDGPWATLSLRRSDILSMREYVDDDGVPLVRLRISEYAHINDDHGNRLIVLYVPGTLEKISKIIGKM